MAEYLIILCVDVSVPPCLPKVPSERFNKELNGKNYAEEDSWDFWGERHSGEDSERKDAEEVGSTLAMYCREGRQRATWRNVN